MDDLFLKIHFFSRTTHYIRNWGGPKENISRRRVWSDRCRGSPEALAVWKKSKIGSGGVIAYSKGCSKNLFTLENIWSFHLPSTGLDRSDVRYKTTSCTLFISETFWIISGRHVCQFLLFTFLNLSWIAPQKKNQDKFFCSYFEFPVQGGFQKHMAFKTTHNKDESLPQFMKSPQLIFSLFH